MTIQDANKKCGYIQCDNSTERDLVAQALHKAGIVHITTGSKTIQDYEARVRRKFYTDDHLVISLYGGDFFGIQEEVRPGYPIHKASVIIFFTAQNER